MIGTKKLMRELIPLNERQGAPSSRAIVAIRKAVMTASFSELDGGVEFKPSALKTLDQFPADLVSQELAPLLLGSRATMEDATSGLERLRCMQIGIVASELCELYRPPELTSTAS